MEPWAAAWDKEWLEADGRGGFASGTVGGIRTRRYHALLLHATAPPAGRVVLVNGIEAWIEAEGRPCPLSAQRYQPDVVHPDGHSRIIDFRVDPWPTWRIRLGNFEIQQEILSIHGGGTVLRWSVIGAESAARLHVRPLLSGRDYHSLHRENPAFQFGAGLHSAGVSWRPYPSLPAVHAISNGAYEHRPDWYRNFLYSEEQARGLDCVEDLASPGVFSWDLRDGAAVMMLRVASDSAPSSAVAEPPAQWVNRLVEAERRRRAALGSPVDRAADAYVVSRGSGKTIVAGYPWFTDWGRDTFIALRGLCVARGDLVTARDILIEWSGAVSEGMLPNRFPDAGEAPEFNSVDASLWFVIAVHDYLNAVSASGGTDNEECARLRRAVEEILDGYSRGTRFGIRANADGLLAAGAPDVQLTWMDAKVGDWVVTPRIGKPVEVNALWLNAMRIAGDWSPIWRKRFDSSMRVFRGRFWREDAGCCYDVVDVDHIPGRCDSAMRPNQIFAVGGLPFPLLGGAQARRLVDAVEARLLTPRGLRSLAPDDAGYRPRYAGGVWERDSAYHQGTVWPWLIGPFVEAWLRVREFSESAREEARRRFIDPLLAHLCEAGLGHVSEVTDGDAPHRPGGCPFQAWSLGELIRARAMTEPLQTHGKTVEAEPTGKGRSTAGRTSSRGRR